MEHTTNLNVALDELLESPELVADIGGEAVPGLLAVLAGRQARLTALQSALSVKLLEPRPTPTTTENDKLLTIEEAASALGVPKSWLYRHSRRLPFTVKLSHKKVRFSEAGSRRYITRMGRVKAT